MRECWKWHFPTNPHVRLLGWFAVCHNFRKGEILHCHAIIGALVEKYCLLFDGQICSDLSYFKFGLNQNWIKTNAIFKVYQLRPQENPHERRPTHRRDGGFQ